MVLAVPRLMQPFEIDSMEGGHIAMTARLAAGQPLYPQPGIHYAPLNYTPVFFHAAEFVERLHLGVYFGIRAVSLFGALWAALLIVVVARKSRASTMITLAAVGTFLGYSSRCSFNLDSGRVDTLALAFSLSALTLLFEGRRTLMFAVVAGALAGLGFLTKQTMIVWMVVPAVWLAFHRDWSRSFAFAAAAGLTIVGVLWWWGYLFDPWFYYCIFKVQSTHHIRLLGLLVLAPVYLILTLPAGLFFGVLGSAIGDIPGALGARLRRWLEDPWAVLLLVFIAMALAAKAKDGGGENVFIPVVALGAVQIARLGDRLAR
ncbi:MAG: hypothetical protein WC889_10455, partial [Myxococcota bacterium]